MDTNTKPVVYWTLIAFKEWTFYIAASEQGLCYVGPQDKPFSELADWVKFRLPGSSLERDDDRLEQASVELKEYLLGERRSFSVPLDLYGTPFQQSVWQALCDIPYGHTWSYSDVALHIHKPASVRAVGAAIGANPILITVPCHRVIGKNGAMTGYRGGLNMKIELLGLEQKASLVDAK
ncbi:methylated-DNA--[protein]-cysteine S-methyltransferase [Paenibacillus sp. sgz500958]|uniref:methylated-DNA--[protein]-cysteine S-methyltransferase n=1 Tax=Paenibacillus sp. sgz500958 TaxID=3242475 RepID=UPI0036D36ECA